MKMDASKRFSISRSIVSMDDIDELLEETEELSSLLSIEGAVEEPLLLELDDDEEQSSLLVELWLLSLPKSEKSNSRDGGTAASTPLCIKAWLRKASVTPELNVISL